jgi:hypothetical protein
MADIRESSLLFSLNRLMEHEKERVLDEQRDRELRSVQERALRERLEQQKKEAERRRLVDEERRKIAEAGRLREEAARVEAIRSAQLERVRAQVAEKTQLELQAKQHEHERRMDGMRRDARLRRYQAWSLASSLLACLFVLGGVGLYFGKLAPDSSRAHALLEARVAVQHERANLAEAAADQSRAEVSALELELARSRRDLGKARERVNELETAGKAGPKFIEARPTAPASRTRSEKLACKSGAEGDPMNGCLTL